MERLVGYDHLPLFRHRLIAHRLRSHIDICLIAYRVTDTYRLDLFDNIIVSSMQYPGVSVGTLVLPLVKLYKI